jgi:7-cyano-7-deazaguanine synthase
MLNKNAVVIFSGGQDSTTCLALAKKSGFNVYALSFDYGQKNKSELEAAKAIAVKLKINHKILDIRSIGALGGSALTDQNVDIEKHRDRPDLCDIPSTYVPARNTIFLSIALGYAEIINASAIYIGIAKDDGLNYPDGRLIFVDSFRDVVKTGTKSGINGVEIEIVTPLINMSKTDIITKGISLGIDYKDTVTCYLATDSGLACGVCDSCHLRRTAFEDLRIEDQTYYQ